MFDRRANGACRAGKRLLLSEVWIDLFELTHLPSGSPTQITVAGVSQIQVRYLPEPTRSVKTRGQFVSECLIVGEAICLRRADRVLVKTLSIELAALDPGDLGPDQRGAVLEILRAIRRQDLQLPVVSGQGLDILASLASYPGRAGCRLRECTVEVILRRFEQ